MPGSERAVVAPVDHQHVRARAGRPRWACPSAPRAIQGRTSGSCSEPRTKTELLADAAQRPADHVGRHEQRDPVERDGRVPGEELGASEAELPVRPALLEVEADEGDRSPRLPEPEPGRSTGRLRASSPRPRRCRRPPGRSRPRACPGGRSGRPRITHFGRRTRRVGPADPGPDVDAEDLTPGPLPVTSWVYEPPKRGSSPSLRNSSR